MYQMKCSLELIQKERSVLYGIRILQNQYTAAEH